MPHGNRATLNNITAATRVLASQNAFEERLTQSKKVPNQSWDPVNVLSVRCAQLLVAGKGMMPALKNSNIRKHVDDIAALDANAHILARELMAYTGQLLELHKQHEGKTGEAQGPDENFLAINIFNGYVQWYEKYTAIVQPTVHHMLEIIRIAEGRLREEDNDAADALGAETSQTLDNVLGREPVQSEPAADTPSQEQAPAQQGRGLTSSIIHVDDSAFIEDKNTDPAAQADSEVDQNPTE